MHRGAGSFILGPQSQLLFEKGSDALSCRGTSACVAGWRQAPMGEVVTACAHMVLVFSMHKIYGSAKVPL